MNGRGIKGLCSQKISSINKIDKRRKLMTSAKGKWTKEDPNKDNKK